MEKEILEILKSIQLDRNTISEKNNKELVVTTVNSHLNRVEKCILSEINY